MVRVHIQGASMTGCKVQHFITWCIACPLKHQEQLKTHRDKTKTNTIVIYQKVSCIVIGYYVRDQFQNYRFYFWRESQFTVFTMVCDLLFWLSHPNITTYVYTLPLHANCSYTAFDLIYLSYVAGTFYNSLDSFDFDIYIHIFIHMAMGLFCTLLYTRYMTLDICMHNRTICMVSDLGRGLTPWDPCAWRFPQRIYSKDT